MANAGPDTNTAHFSIMMGPAPHLNGHYTIFGQVVSGFDVVDAINALRCGGRGGARGGDGGGSKARARRSARLSSHPPLLLQLAARASPITLPLRRTAR